MIARVVNQAADVIHRAQVNGAQTAAGLAIALESARLLVSDEMVHEMAALEAERDGLLARVAELEADASTARTEAIADVGDLLDDVGQKDAAHIVYTVDIPKARDMRTVAVAVEGEGEHYAVVHHDYRLGHDLPETGGAR